MAAAGGIVVGRKHPCGKVREDNRSRRGILEDAASGRFQRLGLGIGRHVVASVEEEHAHAIRFAVLVLAAFGLLGMTQARAHLQQLFQGDDAARVAGALPGGDGGGFVEPQAAVAHELADHQRRDALPHAPAG